MSAGLDLYDYNARYYEGHWGRFTSVDPLAEKYYSTSPYVYCLNNPLKYTDPNGDTVRIYTETADFGHAWMSVGEGDNMVVYSFGPGEDGNKYSSGHTFSGKGNLMKYTGQDALDYNNKKRESTDMAVHTIAGVSDEQIEKLVEGIIDKSTSVFKYKNETIHRDPVTGNIVSRDIHGTTESFYTGQSYGGYNVLSNNCTTFVSDVLNAAQSSILSTQKTTYPYRSPKSVSIQNRYVNPANLRERLKK